MIICKIIASKFIAAQRRKHIAPKLSTSYHRCIKCYYSAYDRLTFMDWVRLIIFGSVTTNKWCHWGTFFGILNMLVYVLCPLTPFIIMKCVAQPMDKVWVLPDHYDIQQDTNYLLFDKIKAALSQEDDLELLQCICSILKALTANRIMIAIKSMNNYQINTDNAEKHRNRIQECRN